MKFNLAEAIPILERTPDVVTLLLSGLPESWTHQNEGPDTWSPYDIVGHFIHGEKTDWIPRAKIILEDNPDKTFEPFDRFAQFENSKGKSLDLLLAEFARLRKENMEALKSLTVTEETLKWKGTHPELGVVNLGQLLSTWVTHDLGHIAQISRVMARQYKGEVGPWMAYIPVLSR